MATTLANNVYFPSRGEPDVEVGTAPLRSVNPLKNSLNVNFFLPRNDEPMFRVTNPLFFDPGKVPTKQLQSIASPEAIASGASMENASAEKVILGPLVLGTGDMVADLAGKTHGVYNQIIMMQGVEDPVGLVGISVASVFSIISGAFTAYDGYREERLAKKIGDVWGRALAGLKTLRGTVTTTASTLSLPARALTLTALATTSKVIIATAGIFSTISASLFSTIGMIYLVINSIKVHLQRGFDQEFAAVLNNPELSSEEKNSAGLEFLQAKLRVTDEEKVAIRADVETNPRYQDLSLEKKEAKIESKISKLSKKKEEELKRVTNAECVDKIKKAEPSSATEVVEAVLAQARKNMIFNALGITISILGISAMVIAVAFTGPGALLAAGILSMIVTAGLFGFDLYYLFQDFQQSQPGRYDKLCLLFSSILGFGAATAAICFSMNPIAIACAAVFGLVWLTINLICFWRLRQLEKAKAAST